MTRFAEDPGLYLPPAVYVAPTSGGFQIDVSRHAGGGLELWQVQPGYGPTTKLRQLFPPGETKMAEGLPSFFTFTLRTAAGAVVAQRNQSFCPTSDFGGARVDASGPPNPTYPYFVAVGSLDAPSGASTAAGRCRSTRSSTCGPDARRMATTR